MWWVRKHGVSFYDERNDGKEAVNVSVIILFLDIILYDYLFLLNLWMALGIDMVVVIFLLKGDSLVEWMLDCCACMWNLTVDSEIGVCLVTCFIVNSGQAWGKPFLIALHQVEIVVEKAP